MARKKAIEPVEIVETVDVETNAPVMEEMVWVESVGPNGRMMIQVPKKG